MFPSIDDVTKDMLTDSGELQRAYLVTKAYQEAYDSYRDKHKDHLVSEADLHLHAENFGLTVISLVFGQKP